MKKKLPNFFFEKERSRIKNESKQDIRHVIYSADVVKGKVKALFILPPKYIEDRKMAIVHENVKCRAYA